MQKSCHNPKKCHNPTLTYKVTPNCPQQKIIPPKSHKSHKIFRSASPLCLTQISQIPQFCTPDAKSHRCFTHPCSLRLTQISQIPQFCTPDAKSHRSSPHLCSLRLTQIQRDSTKIICVSFGNLSTRSTQSTPTRSTTHLPTSVRFNTIKRKIQ